MSTTTETGPRIPQAMTDAIAAADALIATSTDESSSSITLDNALARAQEVTLAAGLHGVCEILQEARQALADAAPR